MNKVIARVSDALETTVTMPFVLSIRGKQELVFRFLEYRFL